MSEITPTQEKLLTTFEDKLLKAIEVDEPSAAMFTVAAKYIAYRNIGSEAKQGDKASQIAEAIMRDAPDNVMELPPLDKAPDAALTEETG